MARRKSRPVASDSRLFVMALGLLVGFVIAFVLVLSRLPVDSVISEYNNDAVRGAEVKEMNFDYHSVLQAQKAARKPEPQLVTLVEAPVTPPVLPEVVAVVEPPAVIRKPQKQPVALMPVSQRPAIVLRPDVQPNALPSPVEITRMTTPAPPAVLSVPKVQSSASESSQRSIPVREVMAGNSGQDSFYVEAGNYQDNNDAVDAQSVIRGLGLEAFIVVRQDNRGSFGHRVRIGPFFEQSLLDTARTTLRERGIPAKLIRVKG